MKATQSDIRLLKQIAADAGHQITDKEAEDAHRNIEAECEMVGGSYYEKAKEYFCC